MHNSSYLIWETYNMESCEHRSISCLFFESPSAVEATMLCSSVLMVGNRIIWGKQNKTKRIAVVWLVDFGGEIYLLLLLFFGFVWGFLPLIGSGAEMGAVGREGIKKTKYRALDFS